MNPGAVDLPGTDTDTEALFRRTMAYATDEAWNRGVDEQALAALYDVLNPSDNSPDAVESERPESSGDALPQ